MLEFLLILFELYFPIFIYKNVNISPPFFLLLIILISFKYGNRSSIIISFFIGFIKDILIQYSWFGFITLLTSAFAYILSYILKLNDISIKYVLSLLLILFYFYFYYLFQFSGSFIFYLELSLVRTLVTIISYFIIKLIFKRSFI